jgi:hypothetical protein
MGAAGFFARLVQSSRLGWVGVLKDDKALAKASLAYETRGRDLMAWTRPGEQFATVG